jgi:predicted MFS family arabinose efflux permease
VEKTEHELSAGVRLLFHDPLIRPVVVTVTVFMLSLGAVNVAEVFFITRTLHASAFFYGLVGTSFGVGSVVGALASRRLHQDPLALVRNSLIGVALISVLLGSVGLMEHVVYVFPLMTVTGLAVGVVNVAASTLFAVQTPEDLRGRVFAATGAMFTSAEISSMVLGGLLLTLLAPRTIFQLAGVVSTLTVGVVGPLEMRTSLRAHARARHSQGD